MIATRVGRLLGRNTRAAALFDVKVEAGRATAGASAVDEAKRLAGVGALERRLLRVAQQCHGLEAEDLWRAYIQLTEAEAAFRIHKSDLAIRPVWHQKEHRVQAHILVCFLSYVLWKTIWRRCRQAGLGDEPRHVFAETPRGHPGRRGASDTQRATIRKRCISQPTEHQQILLQRLGLHLPTSIEIAAM